MRQGRLGPRCRPPVGVPGVFPPCGSGGCKEAPTLSEQRGLRGAVSRTWASADVSSVQVARLRARPHRGPGARRPARARVARASRLRIGGKGLGCVAPTTEPRRKAVWPGNAEDREGVVPTARTSSGLLHRRGPRPGSREPRQEKSPLHLNRVLPVAKLLPSRRGRGGGRPFRGRLCRDRRRWRGR